MLSPNTILQSRYRIIRQLGEGGMGAVYEAIDERVSCVVAVKETLAAKDGEARRAFEREAALLANLRHASLPKVMDYFAEDGGQFLVMEFVPGYDLAELLEMRGAAFPTAQVLQWADDLLKVLDYLHSRKPPILHRDIKPSNLKLTRQGEIFLLDFGLAKGSAGQMPTLLTSRSVRGYTPVYASLEQMHGKGTDPRSDLYSLGATLYHLLTGAPPKDAPTRFDALEDERPDPLQPIDEVNPQVSLAVVAVIHRAMAVSRRARPANATEMRRLLHEAAEETRLAETDHLVKLEQEKRQAEEAARLHAEAEAAEAETTRRLAAEAEERRRQEETETLRLQEEQRQAEEERRRFEGRSVAAKKAWETRRQSVEQEQQKPRGESVTEIPTVTASPTTPAEMPKTSVSPTQRAQPSATPDTPADKTIKGMPPDIVSLKDKGAASPVAAFVPAVSTSTDRNRRGRLIALITLATIAIVIAVALSQQKKSGDVPPVSGEQSPGAQPSSLSVTTQTPPPPATVDGVSVDSQSGSQASVTQPSPAKTSQTPPLAEITPEINSNISNASSEASNEEQKRLTSVNTSETPEGSAITIISDSALNDYSAYRSGDRFYILIPGVDGSSVASGLRGRGFADLRVQKRGKDVLLSFRLISASTARASQKFNRLEIIITVPALVAANAQASRQQKKKSP